MGGEVWKFKVQHGADATVRLPWGAQILDVGCQGEVVYLWALVTPVNSGTDRRIAYFATGEPIPDGWEYVGTGHAPGPYVWHVFEEVLF